MKFTSFYYQIYRLFRFIEEGVRSQKILTLVDTQTTKHFSRGFVCLKNALHVGGNGKKAG